MWLESSLCYINKAEAFSSSKEQTVSKPELQQRRSQNLSFCFVLLKLLQIVKGLIRCLTTRFQNFMLDMLYIKSKFHHSSETSFKTVKYEDLKKKAIDCKSKTSADTQDSEQSTV